MLVDDCGCGPRFAEETPPRHPTRGEWDGEDLDRDVSVQGGVEGLEHHTHSAAAEHPLDLVVPDPPKRVGPVRRGEEIERFIGHRHRIAWVGGVGPEVAADRQQTAVVLDQPVECLAAPSRTRSKCRSSSVTSTGGRRSSANRRRRSGSQGFSREGTVHLVDDCRRLVTALLDPTPQAGKDPAAGDVDGPDRQPQFGRHLAQRTALEPRSARTLARSRV